MQHIVAIRRLFLLLVGLLSAIANTSAAAPLHPANYGIQLTDLGAGNLPKAINNAGQVVGQGNGQAFLWTNGTLTTLGTLGGTQSAANDLNDSGIVVGWSFDANGLKRAFQWTSANGMENLGAAFIAETVAEAVNNRGQIVGWLQDAEGFQSMSWDHVTPEGEALFTNSNHKALGVNDNGSVVGITVETNGDADEGYYWNGSGASDFTSILGHNYFPYAGINSQDLTAGFDGDQATFLEIGKLQPDTLGKLLPGDDFSIAYGLNDLGQIVGMSGNKGFLYDPTTNQLLDLNSFARATSGFGSILRLLDINNDGTFIGVALIDGEEHGIVGQFVPVPEPNIVMTCLIGIVACAFYRVKRRQLL